MTVMRTPFLFGVLMFLTACVSGSEPATQPAVVKAYTVQTVQVSVAKGAAKGRFEDQAVRDAAIASLKADLKAKAAAVPGGATPATAQVTIVSMKLKEAGARSFGGANEIVANVRVVDSRGRVLREIDQVRYWDQAKRNESTFNGLPIGLLINMGRNASDAKSGEDLNKLLGGFSDAFVVWLKN